VVDPAFTPTVLTLRRVAEVFGALVGTDARATAISIGRHGHALRVDVSTPEPGRFIGRRGATADEVRAALADLLGDPDLQLNIVEVSEEGPPLDPPAGVREPRRPGPHGPSLLGIHLDRPVDGAPPDIAGRHTVYDAPTGHPATATEADDSRGAA
jgi:predicted RNA-binding protein YlqC (UPF0109 family)